MSPSAWEEISTIFPQGSVAEIGESHTKPNKIPIKWISLTAIMQLLTHYFLHLGFPLIIAWIFFRHNWKKAYLLMLATMLVDLDHLLADPVFVADRCSIQFHPLHTYWAMIGYVILLFFRWPFRVIGIGLGFHMLTDFVDCLMTYARCRTCMASSPLFEIFSGVP